MKRRRKRRYPSIGEQLGEQGEENLPPYILPGSPDPGRERWREGAAVQAVQTPITSYFQPMDSPTVRKDATTPLGEHTGLGLRQSTLDPGLEDVGIGNKAGLERTRRMTQLRLEDVLKESSKPVEECEEVVEEPKTKNIPETGLPSVGKAEKLTNRESQEESQDVRKDMRMMNEDVIKDECVKDCAWGVKGWCKTHSAYGKKKCVTSKKWTKKPNVK